MANNKKLTLHTPFLMNLTILLIDNDEQQLQTISEYINNHGGMCKTVSTGAKALALIEGTQFDVSLTAIILDDNGNSATGADLIEEIKLVDKELTIILITSHMEDMLSTLITKDVYAILPKPIDTVALGLILKQAARNTKLARNNKYLADHLRDKISQMQVDRDKIFLNTLLSLSEALEQKDQYTQHHSLKVADIAEKICLEHSSDEHLLQDVIIAGKLHDIGKIGIPDDILFAKRKLTPEEYLIIKKHVDMSYRIVKPVDVLGTISSYVLHHHERWDGKGYPHQLEGRAIPIGSRILAVADVFNALISARPYRPAMSIDAAFEILEADKGTAFDPEIIDIFYKLVKLGKIKI
jgi:Response regulator containing a CheY-like receiver domain and an HD-GYP domain